MALYPRTKVGTFRASGGRQDYWTNAAHTVDSISPITYRWSVFGCFFPPKNREAEAEGSKPRKGEVVEKKDISDRP